VTKKLVATLILCALAQPCLAANRGSVSLHHEQRDGNRASGVSFTAYNRGLSLGISANRITSNQPLELQDRTTIYPVYAFASLAFRMPVTPYVEWGIDLGDYLLNESSNESSKNHDGDKPRLDNVDVYGAIGIKTSMRRTPIDFSIYVKNYRLAFNSSYNYTNQRPEDSIITMSGANIIFNF